MRKVVITLLSCFYYLYSGAQESPKRLNILVSYSVGLQTFRLDAIEATSHERLQRNLPYNGFYSENDFGPTVMNHVAVAGTVFKNKRWWLELNADWGKNKTSGSYFSTDDNGNPIMAESKSDFRILYTGYAIKKDFDFGKYGVLSPSIGFSTAWGGFFNTKITVQAKDKVTGEQLYSKNGIGAGGDIYRYNSPYILWFFDNPRLGVNYKMKITTHLAFNISYSYWWANCIANDLYSTRKTFLLGNSNRTPNSQLPYHKDLYSHNFSIGLSYRVWR